MCIRSRLILSTLISYGLYTPKYQVHYRCALKLQHYRADSGFMRSSVRGLSIRIKEEESYELGPQTPPCQRSKGRTPPKAVKNRNSVAQPVLFTLMMMSYLLVVIVKCGQGVWPASPKAHLKKWALWLYSLHGYPGITPEYPRKLSILGSML